MKRYWEPAPPADARLDRYRQGMAHVYDGGRLVAHLATKVDVWWTAEGPWWRRRNVRPEERVAWLLTFEPGFDLAHPDGWADGVDADVNELDDDQFAYRGRLLQVELLKGEQAQMHVERYGW